MSIKRIVLIVLALLTIALPCAAEQSEDKEDLILDAVNELQKWIDRLDQALPEIADADSKYVVGKMLDEMNLAHSVAYNSILVEAAPPEEPQARAVPVFSWESGADEGYGKLITLQTDMVEGDSGLGYACTMTYHDQYYRVLLSTCDQEGNELLQVRMEIAAKKAETLLTMMMYNAQMDYVARIATWLRDEGAMTVHKQVFGSQMDIVLKPKEWCEGKQELVEFSKDLLLPAV